MASIVTIKVPGEGILAVSTIELDCPKCKTRFSIDASLSLSVCKCSKCGQVMKVPASAQPAAKPEGERPAAPGGEASNPTAATPKAIPETAKAASAAGPKKKSMRMSKIVIVAAALLLVGGLVGLIVFAMGGSGVTTVEKEINQVMGWFDRNVNPFQLKKPNFFGVPISKNAVIALDGSGTSKDWLGLAKETIVAAAGMAGAKGQLKVVVWSEDEAQPAFPKGAAEAMGEANVKKLQSFLDEVYPVGQAEPAAAVKASLAVNPAQVIFVTSQFLTREQIRPVEAAMAAHKGVRFDVIVLDSAIPEELKELTGAHGGVHVEMPLPRLNDWYREAKK